MTEVKFVFTGYLNIADTVEDIMETAIERVRISYGNEVADYGVFTVEGEKAICGDHLVPDCGCKI
jgi:hypothetical protein